ncbi:glycosyltransferase [Niabella ginsengisoli]|uniref:glycosyltransferase n=1 Tax=Niabella ginsengisoli TaxID=522298 RepID=UPI00374C9908
MFTTALLISTYNWPEALQLCIQSANNQSVLPNEVVVCDDGSNAATKRLLEELSKKQAFQSGTFGSLMMGFALRKSGTKE